MSSGAEIVETDSQCTIGPEDRLSRLPPELLERIFELAFEEGPDPKGPASRALLPFDRAARFKGVTIHEPDGYVRLLDLVTRRPDIGGLVKKLECSYEANLRSDFPFLQLFTLLSNLSALCICDEYPPPIAEFTFTAAFPLAVPHLKAFNIEMSYDMVDGWAPARYRHLAALPYLTDLVIRLECSPINLAAIGLTDETYTFPCLLSLELASGFYQRPPDETVPMIKACPSLRTLVLVNWEVADYTQALSAAPSSLEHLALGVAVDCEVLEWDTQPVAVDTLLPRFPHLTALHLGPGMFSQTTLLKNLQHLPALSSISFGALAAAGSNLLHRLVSGQSRLPSLKHLKLDMYCLLHSRGTPEQPVFSLYCGWTGMWRYYDPTADPQQLEPDEAAALVAAAAREGITVDGSVPEAAAQLAEERAKQSGQVETE
ncbi:hypothetical protein JCM10207_007862 [Rhodosporidiobolus poonsookiae]